MITETPVRLLFLGMLATSLAGQRIPEAEVPPDEIAAPMVVIEAAVFRASSMLRAGDFAIATETSSRPDSADPETVDRAVTVRWSRDARYRGELVAAVVHNVETSRTWRLRHLKLLTTSDQSDAWTVRAMMFANRRRAVAEPPPGGEANDGERRANGGHEYVTLPSCARAVAQVIDLARETQDARTTWRSIEFETTGEQPIARVVIEVTGDGYHRRMHEVEERIAAACRTDGSALRSLSWGTAEQPVARKVGGRFTREIALRDTARKHGG